MNGTEMKEMKNKSTLKLYRENKNIISQVKWMRNFSFSISCNKIHKSRQQYIHLQLPINYNKQEIMKVIILFNKDENYNNEFFINMFHKL